MSAISESVWPSRSCRSRAIRSRSSETASRASSSRAARSSRFARVALPSAAVIEPTREDRERVRGDGRAVRAGRGEPAADRRRGDADRDRRRDRGRQEPFRPRRRRRRTAARTSRGAPSASVSPAIAARSASAARIARFPRRASAPDGREQRHVERDEGGQRERRSRRVARAPRSRSARSDTGPIRKSRPSSWAARMRTRRAGQLLAVSRSTSITGSSCRIAGVRPPGAPGVAAAAHRQRQGEAVDDDDRGHEVQHMRATALAPSARQDGPIIEIASAVEPTNAHRERG